MPLCPITCVTQKGIVYIVFIKKEEVILFQKMLTVKVSHNTQTKHTVKIEEEDSNG